jgi:asparagine synthase (glutamine-hydrolysing)
LSGAGGDELFGGYSRYKEYSNLKSIAGQVIYGRNKKKSYFDICKVGNRGHWKTFFSWYKPDSFKDNFENKWNKYKDHDKLNAMMLTDLEYYLQDDILFMTDKMTMATSLECRVPLLDHRLVELAQTISSDHKIKNGEKKYIFKKIAEKQIPKEVLYRKKEGFGFPIEKWINDHKDLYFDVLMENGYMVKNNLINKNALRNIILKTNLKKQEAWYYWQIIVLEIWFQIFVEGKNYQNVFDID